MLELAGLLVDGLRGLRDRVLRLLGGVEVDDLVASPCRLTTLRYGVWMKPNSDTVAIDASEPIRPMFGPSGVSIGHMRP